MHLTAFYDCWLKVNSRLLMDIVDGNKFTLVAVGIITFKPVCIGEHVTFKKELVTLTSYRYFAKKVA